MITWFHHTNGAKTNLSVFITTASVAAPTTRNAKIFATIAKISLNPKLKAIFVSSLSRDLEVPLIQPTHFNLK